MKTRPSAVTKRAPHLDPLPDDLAKPADPGRASFITNVIVGAVLMTICAVLLGYALFGLS